MNNEKMNQIIDKVYGNYCTQLAKDSFLSLRNRLPQDVFIYKCKTDTEFSKKWGLRIEERELSFEEKFEYVRELTTPTTNKIEQILIALSIPTKLITITYNDIKTEIYES